jgi:hypothetical protein
MKRNIIKLNANDKRILQEVTRRIQCFKDGKMDDELTLLEYRSNIKNLLDKNILSLYGDYPKNCLTWSHLTPRGIKIMKQFKRKGLFCDKNDYEGKSIKTLPSKVIIYE